MSIEAMKQALEALDEVTGWTWAGPMRVMDEVEDAITSLRQAIAEAEKQEPRGYFQINDYDMLEQITGTSGTPLYETPQPCPTCEALARTVLMDQGGTA